MGKLTDKWIQRFNAKHQLDLLERKLKETEEDYVVCLSSTKDQDTLQGKILGLKEGICALRTLLN